jgi:hypothetical protein|eukprot:COSAG01_NODE_15250_length_1357_cov_3.108903_2_plen_34_part_00
MLWCAGAAGGQAKLEKQAKQSQGGSDPEESKEL